MGKPAFTPGSLSKNHVIQSKPPKLWADFLISSMNVLIHVLCILHDCCEDYNYKAWYFVLP